MWQGQIFGTSAGGTSVLWAGWGKGGSQRTTAISIHHRLFGSGKGTILIYVCWFWLTLHLRHLIVICYCLVTKSCLILCNPMDYSTTDFPIHHQLPEFVQTHVHWIKDAINHLILCCPLLLLPSIFPRLKVFSNESALHIWWPSIGASASAPMYIQGWFPLGWTGLISLLSKGLSRVFSSTIGQKHHSCSS